MMSVVFFLIFCITAMFICSQILGNTEKWEKMLKYRFTEVETESFFFLRKIILHVLERWQQNLAWFEVNFHVAIYNFQIK